MITEENENEDFGDFKTVEEVTTDKHEKEETNEEEDFEIPAFLRRQKF